jgi:hypothetical protein
VDVPEPPRGFDTGAICAISMDDPRAQRDLQPRAPRLEPEDKALAASDRQQRRVQFVQGFASLGIGRKHVLHFWSREVCVIVSGSAGDDAMRQANPSKNPRGTVGAPQRRCRAGTDDRNGQGERRSGSGSDDQRHGDTPAQPQGVASQRSTDRPHDRRGLGRTTSLAPRTARGLTARHLSLPVGGHFAAWSALACLL